jgi:hypothetical protein
MATYTLDLNRDYGDRLQSTKDSSVVNIPAADCTDLDGCGVNTHIKGGYNFTANYRENCEPPVTGLQYSYSGLVALSSAGVISSSLFGWAGTLAGVDIAVSTDTLLSYMVNSASTPGYGNSNLGILSAFGISAGATIKKQGKNYSIVSESNRRIIGTIQRPSISSAIDQCGLLTGVRVKSNLSLFGFDENECKPILIWQSSIGTNYANYLYDTLEGPGALAGILVPDVNKFATDSILQQGNPVAAGICDTVANAVESIYSSIGNTSIEIGVGE